MASVTATANPEAEASAPERSSILPGSRLGRLIVALNLLGLAILIAGALVLNELRQGLIAAKIDSLSTQGAFISNVIDQAATTGEPAPSLDPDRAREVLQLLFIPRSQRARVFDARGNLIADSYVIGDRVEQIPLPPALRPGQPEPWRFSLFHHFRTPAAAAQLARDQLRLEVAQALTGQTVRMRRTAQNGHQVVSISIPLHNVQAVLGVLTLESGDVDQIVGAQRRALLPFILMAIAVTLLSSLALSRFIAEPVLRLARAADRVTLSRARAISLPDIARRDDELGDLTRSLETMTRSLSERMDAIERFAADVAHEIRNPLTSIRSAVETLELVSDPAAKTRLAGILKHDVDRLDRLITDISNASRLDAELSREEPRALDLRSLLKELTELYEQAASPGQAPVRFVRPEGGESFVVMGREGPLSQVFRNLIDNARSFSTLSRLENPQVRVLIQRSGRHVTATVEDDGPGVPPENLETVFERFYTSRPKGAAFGGNSGLGLSIARQIVEAHSGTIHAENRVDDAGAIAGARFVVSLPEARP
jgi:two-component system sensor histidine kinase ChvG